MKGFKPFGLNMSKSFSRDLQALETELRRIAQGLKRSKTNCKVGKIYCKPGTVCKPIEGIFCTECELCDKFN